VARWNGQTQGDHAFSVAEHSVVVEQLCGDLEPDWPAKWRLAALLHDAAEYVIGT
jgi:5'-deoxynucleotidase YfbR-like HD superfamily hydrolase